MLSVYLFVCLCASSTHIQVDWEEPIENVGQEGYKSAHAMFSSLSDTRGLLCPVSYGELTKYAGRTTIQRDRACHNPNASC